MYAEVRCTHMGEGEYTRVNMRVESDTKERWTDFVDESDNYTSLSGLIRTAVKNEIDQSRAPSGQTDSDSGGQADDDRLAELLERVQRVEEHVVEIEDGVTRVEDRGSVPKEAQVDEPRAYPDGEVFEALPEGDDVGDGETVGQLAEKLPYGEGVVGHTVRLMEQKSGRVKTKRVGEQSVYWKEV